MTLACLDARVDDRELPRGRLQMGSAACASDRCRAQNDEEISGSHSPNELDEALRSEGEVLANDRSTK